MKHKYLEEGRPKNSMEIYDKDNQGGKGSRLGVSLDALVNSPSPRSRLIMLTLIGSELGEDD
jgi:hypothetical protein